MRKRHTPIFGLIAALGLACALATNVAAKGRGGKDAPEKAPAKVAAARSAEREPIIRHLDPEEDAADYKRIWEVRRRLPREFQWRNNFGWARADVEGLEKKEYFAHSGIQNLDGFSAAVAKPLADMSFSPEKGKGLFTTLFVDYRGNVDGPGAIPRWYDTEYKMLEDVAARLTNRAAKGTIRLYTNLEPCPSCRGVMRQFLARYPNVELEVLYEWP